MTDPTDSLSIGTPKPRLLKRVFMRIRWLVTTCFCILSLVVLLASLTAIPIVQLIALGYLLDVSGRLKSGVKLRDSLPQLREAGVVGMAVIAIFIAALPTRLLTHWESVAQVIDANSEQAKFLRVAAMTSSAIATFYLIWAWIRGCHAKILSLATTQTFFSRGLALEDLERCS